MYHFSMYITREDIKTNEKTDTVEYMLKKTYFFNAKDSGCHEQDDVVTVINAPLVVSFFYIYIYIFRG